MLHNQFWNYSGAFALVLVIIYGTRNYLVTLLAGFVVFCAFYFTYAPENENFQFTLNAVLNVLAKAAMIYLSAYAAGALLFTVTRRRAQKRRVES